MSENIVKHLKLHQQFVTFFLGGGGGGSGGDGGKGGVGGGRAIQQGTVALKLI